jgi:hypothetical protein
MRMMLPMYHKQRFADPEFYFFGLCCLFTPLHHMRNAYIDSDESAIYQMVKQTNLSAERRYFDLEFCPSPFCQLR